MTTSLARAALAAMIALGAAPAGAQITTVVTPPEKPPAVQREIARRQEAVQDSIARVTLTGMKEWVDSAASALVLQPDTGRAPAGDTTAAAAPTRSSAGSDSVAASTSEQRPPAGFPEGARAPDTATPIPTLALGGAAMIMIGLALRRKRRSEARAKTRY